MNQKKKIPWISAQDKLTGLKDKFNPNGSINTTIVGIDMGERYAFGACSIIYSNGEKVIGSLENRAIKSDAIKQPQSRHRNWMNRQETKVKSTAIESIGIQSPLESDRERESAEKSAVESALKEYYPSRIFKKKKFTMQGATQSEKDKAIRDLFTMAGIDIGV